MSRCLPLVTNYFIRVISTAFGAIINMTFTNETMYTLNGARMGDVYVIEIVPSSALGNGSATTISISKSHTYILATPKMWQRFQEHVNYHFYLRQSGHFKFKSSWSECLLLPFF